jgi:hypothetical protein
LTELRTKLEELRESAQNVEAPSNQAVRDAEEALRDAMLAQWSPWPEAPSGSGAPDGVPVRPGGVAEGTGVLVQSNSPHDRTGAVKGSPGSTEDSET